MPKITHFVIQPGFRFRLLKSRAWEDATCPVWHKTIKSCLKQSVFWVKSICVLVCRLLWKFLSTDVSYLYSTESKKDSFIVLVKNHPLHLLYFILFTHFWTQGSNAQPHVFQVGACVAELNSQPHFLYFKSLCSRGELNKLDI